MGRTPFILLLFGLFCISTSQGQISERLPLLQNPCVTKTTCRDCIQTPSCAWCMDPDFGDKPRCFDPSYFTSTCPEAFTWNPDNEQSIYMNRLLSRAGAKSGGGQWESGSSYEYSASGSSSFSSSSRGAHGSAASGAAAGAGAASGSGSIVQIAPQRVGLKLRINEKHRLTMQYSQAEDYPVDLYYLMDLSKSMEDDKEKLSKLGDLLSDTMRNITSNFRLGFGSFVDKVLMPYVSTVPKKLLHPCEGCEAPYGFRNHMPLNTNTKSFSEEVRNAAVSGNLDAPEGGFDAIMQSIVCRNQIGWREQARRLLVFSTDAGFHYAGDGKLGGVITPNDGQCHLDTRGMYTHSSLQDYPSISQINMKVKQNSINIIFAVTSTQIGVYEKLAQHIEGSSSAVLSNDSSNVVDLVREEYSKISSSVEMKDNATSALKITYYSACKNGGNLVQTSKCDGLKVGDLVNFTAEIVVTSCPQNPADWFQTFQIYPVGLNESLIVDLEMLCSCPCERPGHKLYEEHSPKCSNFGSYKCGICECDETHFGRKCECSSDVGPGDNRDFGCRPDNTTDIDCNGRGNCICGVCECEKRPNPEEAITGPYCECDNFSCDRHNQLLCSGPDHGRCECGECKCNEGWIGSACDCRASNDTCMPPNGGEICSGHGTCECGVCKCDVTEEGRYSGKYCDKCPTCSGRCQELKDCVQCQMYKTGPLAEGNLCAENCTNVVTIGVDTVTADDEKNEYLCTFYDEDDCRFQFAYTDKEDEKSEVKAQEERECPPKVFMLGIVLGVIAAIVLIGLAFLLLWKLLTTIHDRREFAKFEKERASARWDTGENPIYKQATSTFKNPTYAGK
ncbi:integrin beta-PS isoform X1 [Hermetia illucens]|nr:integrin beta-PS isoform X1 [Hermetia illucens]XP_037919075.1 integrin beta-PS isoform X1 [Hermetia illucens]XP_037919076.1 integrin beta-PS isoform X1 [Hermetia illucens]